MPSARATSSVCDSIAQHACGAVGARTEPDGWWLVYTRCASTCTLGMRYGPATCIAASWREEARVGGVGAVVDGHPTSPRGDGAVVADAGLDVDHHAFAATVGGDELLAAAEHQAHRPLGGAGQRGDVRLVVEAALAAETATEVRAR